MNKKGRPTSNVFLTYGGHDKNIATAIKQKMTDAGLKVFAISDADWEKTPKKRNDLEEMVRQAMLQSSAFIALLSPTRQDSSALAFAFGAARIGDKDIYVLSANKAQVTPTYLRRYPSYTVRDLPKIMPELVQLSRHEAVSTLGGAKGRRRPMPA